MYTEVKELVNFLAKYLIGPMPRRPASMFACHLANQLVLRYREYRWDIENPTADEHQRIIRLKVNGVTDQLITTAALEMGLRAQEILDLLPQNVLLFVNPGEVFYRAGENATAVPIWIGEKGVDPDLMYCSLPARVTNPESTSTTSPKSNMGAAGTPFFVGRSALSDSDPEAEYAFVQLKLEPACSSKAVDNADLPQSNLMVFSYIPKHHESFTVKEFAATRFGSHRKRPDHEAMKRIQREAAARRMEMAAATASRMCTAPPQSLEVIGATDMMPNSNSRTTPHQPTSATNARHITLGDMQALKTLTIQQREALMNIIRGIPMADHHLHGHQSQVLTMPPMAHYPNSGILRSNTNPSSISAIAPSRAGIPSPHHGAESTSMMPMFGRHNNGKHRSGNVSTVTPKNP